MGLRPGQKHVGQFKTGVSPNPGGRPKAVRSVIELARKQTDKAIQVLIDLLDCGDPRERRQAAIALLDRGWGRPHQSMELSGPGGAPLFSPDRMRGMIAFDEQLSVTRSGTEEETEIVHTESGTNGHAENGHVGP